MATKKAVDHLETDEIVKAEGLGLKSMEAKTSYQEI